MIVVNKTFIATPGESFLIRFQPETPVEFTSGDLLAIYPADDHRERFYSIGKLGNEIQLSVKLHEAGLGSTYLHNLQPGDSAQARIDENAHFHFPSKAPVVIMISNGTGIAPFLGMILKNEPDTKRHLYCGFRDQDSFSLYKSAIDETLREGKLEALHVAYSRQGEKQYVKDLLKRDESLIAETILNRGVIMICGSLAMQNSVLGLLEDICQTRMQQPVSYFQSRGQILMDCY